MAVWQGDRFVVIPLTTMILGHWAVLLCVAGSIKAQWVPEQAVCVVVNSQHRLVVGMYAYTMGFDFTVLCLTGYKLGFGLKGKSRLMRMLYLDGMVYFVIA